MHSLLAKGRLLYTHDETITGPCARLHGGTSTSRACEYLADRGLIGKASTPMQLTKKSNVLVQELAFVYLREAEDGDRVWSLFVFSGDL